MAGGIKNASPKSKVVGKGGVSFIKGGSGKMFGKQHSGTQKAGVTEHAPTSSGKFAKGGSGHMFGKQSAQTRMPGKTGK